MQEADKIWMDGALVDWADAKVHVLTHALHYGSGVFEGIRAYKTERQDTGHLRLTDHLERMRAVGGALLHADPYTTAELAGGRPSQSHRGNGLAVLLRAAAGLPRLRRDGHQPPELPGARGRSRSGRGARTWARRPSTPACARWSRRWRRIGPNTVPAAAKATGQYMNSPLAKREAKLAGFDEAIMLDATETWRGTGENVFVVQRGRASTPPLSASSLAGITRDSVLGLARGFGPEVGESESRASSSISRTRCSSPAPQRRSRRVGGGRPRDRRRARSQSDPVALLRRRARGPLAAVRRVPRVPRRRPRRERLVTVQTTIPLALPRPGAARGAARAGGAALRRRSGSGPYATRFEDEFCCHMGGEATGWPSRVSRPCCTWLMLAGGASAPATRSSRPDHVHRLGDACATGRRPRLRRHRPDNVQQSTRRPVEAAITPRTRAIMPIHLNGYPCDMDPNPRHRKAAQPSS